MKLLLYSGWLLFSNNRRRCCLLPAVLRRSSRCLAVRNAIRVCAIHNDILIIRLLLILYGLVSFCGR